MSVAVPKGTSTALPPHGYAFRTVTGNDTVQTHTI